MTVSLFLPVVLAISRIPLASSIKTITRAHSVMCRASRPPLALLLSAECVLAVDGESACPR